MTKETIDSYINSIKAAYEATEKACDKADITGASHEIKKDLDAQRIAAQIIYLEATKKTIVDIKPDTDSIKTNLDKETAAINKSLKNLKLSADIVNAIASIVDLATKLAAVLL